MQYFCTPKNDKLLGYWDTVADRLFKIRHCMNIEGVVRSAAPVRAAHRAGPARAGPPRPGSTSAASLNDINAALPHYRFNVLAQKATELCAELKSLGSALLAALEKKDAEELALTRAKHETALLERVEHVKQQQVEEAARNLGALVGSRQVAVAKYLHYQKLLGVQNPQVPAEPTDGEITPIPDATPSQRVSIPEEGDVKMIPLEKQEMESLQFSHGTQIAASGYDLVASTAHGLPTTIEAPWGVGTMYGGSNVGQAMSAFASYLRLVSSIFSFESDPLGQTGSISHAVQRLDSAE